MTGSGKTGLCVDLLEEVAAAGVPIFAIDPKGDLANLARTEPARDADAWRAGQAQWGISAADVKNWADSVEVRIYTPGSDAGLSVNVLASLRRPASLEDEELRRDRVIGTVSALLSLAGEQADPVRSPSHVVLSRILEEAWLKGEDPDLEALIIALVDPPFTRVGVFPTDKFFKPDDRLDLARRLNTVMVSPAFAAWNRGAPLEIESFLGAAPGRSPINIFSVSHLSEPERHFFVGLLLERLALWSRGLSGTTSLRAMVFFDEVWGYLPPHPHNPPTKRPLLTLFKQARAVGVGTVLATQNPVDLDYKALSNAGTWLIGRLQTKNDKARLMEGLSGAGMDPGEADRWLDQVGPRKFLVHRVGSAPTVLETRWTRAWLGGPLTRAELRALSESNAGDRGVAASHDRGSSVVTAPVRPAVVPRPAPPPATPAHFPAGPRAQWALDPRVAYSARYGGYFEPWLELTPGRLMPGLLVAVALTFDEARVGYRDERIEHRLYFPLGEELPAEPVLLPLQPSDLLDEPPPGSRLDPLPAWLDEQKEVERAVSRVVDTILREESAGYYTNPVLKLHGNAGEDEGQFLARCESAVEERIDDALAAFHTQVKRKVENADAKIRKLDSERKRLASDHAGRQTQEMFNAGEMLLSFFSGRSRSVTSLASHRRSVNAASARVEEVDAEIQAINRELYEVEQEVDAEATRLREREEKALNATIYKPIKLDRGDLKVLQSGLLWVPVWRRQ